MPHPRRFTPGNYPVPIIYEVGKAGLDGCGRSRPPPGSDPRTVQPVAGRYPTTLSRPNYWRSVLVLSWLNADLCGGRGKKTEKKENLQFSLHKAMNQDFYDLDAVVLLKNYFVHWKLFLVVLFVVVTSQIVCIIKPVILKVTKW